MTKHGLSKLTFILVIQNNNESAYKTIQEKNGVVSRSAAKA